MGGEDVVGEVKGGRGWALEFFACWWALFGIRAAGKRPRKGHNVYETPAKTTLTDYTHLFF